jgi:hypothetical protein
MLRLCIVGGLCFVLLAPAVADDPKKQDEKREPLTKEKLLGKWVGPKDVPVTVEFKDDQVIITTVVSDEGGKPKTMTIEWPYAIDPEDNLTVFLKPLDGIRGGLGSGWLNADGTLSAGIVEFPPAFPKGLKTTKFTRVDSKEPKK